MLAGWTVTETGRQPWVIHGLLRTRDAVSPSLTGFDVALSLAVYLVVYLFVFGFGLILLLRLMRTIPTAHDGPGTEASAILGCQRPLAAGMPTEADAPWTPGLP